MKLLNLCCGGNRPQDEFWWNLDELHEVLAQGTPERLNLDAEPRYVDHNVLDYLPFAHEEFDGILASHCFEHWDCKQGVDVMRRCMNCLKPGGVLMVSVPDASYFRLMYVADTAENAVELFGEPIYAPDGENTFFGYALWNRFHKAILTEDSLWSYFIRAGFKDTNIMRISPILHGDEIIHESVKEMHKILNRRLFSLIMVGYKE
jgi:predicted SAM-dependent methyltransferase